MIKRWLDSRCETLAVTAARYRDQQGQVLWVTAATMIALVGVVMLVTNVGAWFGNDRILQRGADVAALAGAQKLALTGDGAAATAAAGANATANSLATSSIQADVSAGWVKVTAVKDKGELPQAMVPASAQHDRHANAKAAVFGVVQAGAVMPLAVPLRRPAGTRDRVVRDAGLQQVERRVRLGQLRRR